MDLLDDDYVDCLANGMLSALQLEGSRRKKGDDQRCEDAFATATPQRWACDQSNAGSGPDVAIIAILAPSH